MASRREFLAATTAAALVSTAAHAADDPKAGSDKDRSAEELLRVMSGDETIAMLLYDKFTALDLIGPHHFLQSMGGAKVHLVSKSLEPVKSDFGLSIAPTVALDDCPKELTILFVPGGTEGTLAAAQDQRILDFLADRGSRAQWVTSVCTGSIVLGAAGLLRGYKATTHWLAMGALEAFGAVPVQQRVVVDRNRVTGAGVTAGLDFALSLVGKLRNPAYAQGVQLLSEYDPDPPFRAGSPEKAPPGVVAMLRHMQGPFERQAKAIGAKQKSGGG